MMAPSSQPPSSINLSILNYGLLCPSCRPRRRRRKFDMTSSLDLLSARSQLRPYPKRLRMYQIVSVAKLNSSIDKFARHKGMLSALISSGRLRLTRFPAYPSNSSGRVCHPSNSERSQSNCMSQTLIKFCVGCKITESWRDYRVPRSFQLCTSQKEVIFSNRPKSVSLYRFFAFSI